MVIKYVFLGMLPYMLVSLPIIIIARLVIHRKAKRILKNINWRHEAAILVFILFIVGLASQTIIPGIFARYDREHFKILVNLVPFNNINYRIFEVLGNIALFVPIGLLLPLLWRRFEKFYVLVYSCLLISLIIELSQLAIPMRATDIDDLIMNTIGGMIGYLLYLLIRRLSKNKTDKWKLTKNSPANSSRANTVQS